MDEAEEPVLEAEPLAEPLADVEVLLSSCSISSKVPPMAAWDEGADEVVSSAAF